MTDYDPREEDHVRCGVCDKRSLLDPCVECREKEEKEEKEKHLYQMRRRT